MKSLPELNDGRLYDLLEAGGQQARLSVRRLASLVEEGGRNPATLAEPAQAAAKIADELCRHLLHAIVASLPKPETENLSRAIAGITVAAERFAERFSLVAGQLNGIDFTPPLNWIEELTEIVLDMIRQLRGFESLDHISELRPRLQDVADRAEGLVQGIVNQAFQRPTHPLEALKVKDLGDRLIEIIDGCREAGEVMSSIAFQFL